MSDYPKYYPWDRNQEQMELDNLKDCGYKEIRHQLLIVRETINNLINDSSVALPKKHWEALEAAKAAIHNML